MSDWAGTLTAPFTWFGGKSRVSPEVWEGLGDVDHYIEPFFGSGAVLFGRPSWHTNSVETVNDIDQFVANFWRAAIHDAEAVTRYADYPINEADLFARHLWLQDIGKQQLQDGLVSDPDWYDAKIAGWWLWGINQWLGTGWCAGTGTWRIVDGKLTRVKNGGAPRQLIHISNPGLGLNGQQKRHWSYEYMEAIANRMRYVRVACGDWRRVLTDGAMYSGRVVGVFLDPPYSDTNKRDKVYTHDSTDIAHEVRRWAIDHGDDPRLRIVLAGYEGEHDMPETWRKVAWTANLTYSSGKKTGQNEKNRTLERLWFSPHCLRPAPTLFDL